MSDDQEDVSSHPLVIVRRRRNTEEPHHGGVWKIAYADFMTAMMAFFLVMWLINAADKKTIVQVAAYFNPMRLTERVATPKGLDDLIEAEPKPTEKKAKKGYEQQVGQKQDLRAEKESTEKSGESMDAAARKIRAGAAGKIAEAQKEQALFDNPGDMLEKLADELKAKQPSTVSNAADGSLRDPFDRLNRKSERQDAPRAAPQVTQPAGPSTSDKMPNASDQASAAAANVTEDGKQAPPEKRKIEDAAKHVEPGQGKVEQAAKPVTPESGESKDETHHEKEAEAKKLEASISTAISHVSRELPHVEVKATPEGLLVSLTDDANFGMFEVGSAKPRPELVIAMEKIGDVLKSVTGKIVVRGHTDSRRYKSGIYDNWRLSAARAQMAYYMLIRGGIAESNVIAIEGRADRDPKVPTDTEAAQNRRIDILIKEDQK